MEASLNMKTLILAGVALLTPLASFAADSIVPFEAKLGLWETTATSEMTGLPQMPAMPQIPKEQLDKMPPEARARMEAMMKSRANIGAPTTTTSKSCIAKDSLSKALMMSDQKDCTRKVVSSTSTKQEIHVECSQGKSGSVGDMTIERVDNEHAKGNMLMKVNSGSTGAQAVNMTMKMSFTSKWVASDCGDVKPVGN
jgi:Protein of unknown function (DUF3617)